MMPVGSASEAAASATATGGAAIGGRRHRFLTGFGNRLNRRRTGDLQDARLQERIHVLAQGAGEDAVLSALARRKTGVLAARTKAQDETKQADEH